MELQRDPMEEIKDYVKENNITEGAFLKASTEYVKKLREELTATKEDLLPPSVKDFIDRSHGDIEYIQERQDDKGFFIVTNDGETGYDVVIVDNSSDSYRLRVKNDFSEREEAIHYVRQLERHDILERPEHHELSEFKVLNVKNEGYYVGRERYDANQNEWIPYSRVTSKPMNNIEEAKHVLDKALEFKKDIAGLSTGNLRVLGKDFQDKIKEDPENELRRNVVIDHLRAERNVKPHVLSEMSR